MNKVKPEVYWYTLKKPTINELESDISTDVLIIGGGMAGLTAAHNLLGKGLSIALVEKDFCGGGASGKTSGFITPASELEFGDLDSKYGNENAKKLWNFAKGGMKEMEEMIEKYHIDCDLQNQDSIFVANSEKDYQTIKEEHDILEENSYKSFLYPKEKLKEVLRSDSYFGGVRCPENFGIISYLYCQGLKEALAKQGVKIYEQTAVEKINGSTALTPSGKTIKAGKTLVCVDHFMPRLGIYPKSVYHAETFLSISKPLSDKEVKSIFPGDKLMVWDTDLVYQYYRLTGGNRLLFGASSLLTTYLPKEKKNSNSIIKKIYKYQQEKFGRTFEIEYIWPGLLGVSKDFLPVVGKHPYLNEVYYISACAGLPWAAASGKYIVEKMMNGRSDLDQFFKAKRKFPVPDWLHYLITKPIAFAISHGIIEFGD